eukprot:Skav232505  [mRNA]  locus=scaffold1096:112452:113117:+ [translate_table: standard]
MGKARIQTKLVVTLFTALVVSLWHHLPLGRPGLPQVFVGNRGARAGSVRTCIVRNAVGVFFATQTGNTETVAGKIGEAVGIEASDYDGEDFADLDGLIAGCPTWNTGADEYRSGTTWDDYVDSIKEYDLKGKVVAVFGCGDSQGYADNFCDGIEELHDAFEAAGAKMIGYVDASGYTFGESKSVKDGKFLGLPLDEDNEDDQTDGRISSWVEQLKSEGMPL